MLDEKFKIRMARLLGDDIGAFTSALEEGRAVRGARINTLKCSVSEFLEASDIPMTPLSYADDGFTLGDADGVGSTPEHHSGMLYIQDPGAMATLNALDIHEDWKVLDMCSAPGGKSGQAAAKIGEGGFILSNEYIPKRAKTVVSNFERLGIKNAIVTSLSTDELPKMFRGVFDLVIADVPCSGEGMFRKSDEALEAWSEENVTASAARQRLILGNAPALVKSGGYLLYSTCTYSLEENEMIIDDFLTKNPEFKLLPVRPELAAKTADGIVFEGAVHPELHLCRRFYPHLSEGEGQFAALMQKQGGDERQAILYKDSSREPTRQERAAVFDFFSEALTKPPAGELRRVGENLVLLSHGFPVPPKSVFSAGVLVGSFERGLLKPSHQFFSAYGRLFKRQENIKRGDRRISAYLRGEEIDAAEISGSGFCAVLYEGVPLGGGKASGGRIKNHYPKGLRNK